MGKYPTSDYVLVVDNLARDTRSGDVRYEMEYFGSVRRCERDRELRVALVEFDRADDAEEAWRKMEGFRMDGKSWKVSWADTQDFRHFGWKWFEGSARPSEGSRRSPSASLPPY